MFREVAEHSIKCPYCGERVTVLVDPSIADQRYVEDCEVCCRPMELSVSLTEGGEVGVSAQDDSE